MTENVKSYLIQKFNRGAKKGNKADARQVEHDMKHARDARGELLFQPNEWRTSKLSPTFLSHSVKQVLKQAGQFLNVWRVMTKSQSVRTQTLKHYSCLLKMSCRQF